MTVENRRPWPQPDFRDSKEFHDAQGISCHAFLGVNEGGPYVRIEVHVASRLPGENSRIAKSVIVGELCDCRDVQEILEGVGPDIHGDPAQVLGLKFSECSATCIRDEQEPEFEPEHEFDPEEALGLGGLGEPMVHLSGRMCLHLRLSPDERRYDAAQIAWHFGIVLFRERSERMLIGIGEKSFSYLNMRSDEQLVGSGKDCFQSRQVFRIQFQDGKWSGAQLDPLDAIVS